MKRLEHFHDYHSPLADARGPVPSRDREGAVFRKVYRYSETALVLIAACCCAYAAEVKTLDVRILSTMLTDGAGVGEWGFSALVTVDGRTILFDTGARPDTVLKNARELKVDLSGVADVILSHNHEDHTGGLVTLRREYPKALGRAHVGPGIFLEREKGGNSMIKTKVEYEALGGKFIEHAEFAQIAPGVWLTGAVPRPHEERNWSGSGQLRDATGKLVEDNLPEDMSMVIETAKGLVLISGCGHAGMINTIDHAQSKFGQKPIHAAIGGFHLFPASDLNLDWTAAKLKAIGLVNFIGAHCTGIEATYRIRERVGLDRRHAVVGAVGAGFKLSEGIQPGMIAR